MMKAANFFTNQQHSLNKEMQVSCHFPRLTNIIKIHDVTESGFTEHL